MKEKNIQSLIQLAVSRACKTVLFRNNTGMAWTGNQFMHIRKPGTAQLSPGDLVIRQARPFHAGLCTGSSDLIGWTVKKITPDMVGKEIAIFTAVEVKKPSGRATKEQVNFINQINQSGGIAGIAKSDLEAVELIQGK
jgi:hypothetical protein